jgi:hypothetical protein
VNFDKISAIVKKKNALLAVALIVASCVAALAQTAGGGRVSGNYGKVFEAAGGSPAARDLRQNLRSTLVRAVQRTKSFQGPRRSTASSSRTVRGVIVAPARPAAAASAATVNHNADFTPNSRLNYSESLAEALGATQQEKEYLRQLFTQTKIAFEKEVAGKGGKNNLAAALTFFIAANVTVYHGDPEPSDAATDKLWSAMNTVFDDTEQFRGLSDLDKQQMYETLIAFGGLSFAGYTVAKSSNDASLMNTYRQLAGVLIQLVLKTSPDQIRFRGDDLIIG